MIRTTKHNLARALLDGAPLYSVGASPSSPTRIFLSVSDVQLESGTRKSFNVTGTQEIHPGILKPNVTVCVQTID